VTTALEDRWLRATEVAERWGMSPATVLDWFERGKLPGYRMGGTKGGRLRFRLSDIERVEESWRVDAATETSG
jgi:excisionase family DNA binding protein